MPPRGKQKARRLNSRSPPQFLPRGGNSSASSSVRRRPSAHVASGAEGETDAIVVQAIPQAFQGPAIDVVSGNGREAIANASLRECPVDGLLVPVADRQASRWYLFTQVTEDVPRAGRKTPEEVGREGLYNTIVEAYHHCFPPGDLCHTRPEFGKVVQEGHAASTVEALRKLHNHAACQFPREHKWKKVEKYLREVKGIKVHISKHP